jgi:hypothetical protein
MQVASAVPVRAIVLLVSLVFGSTARSVAQERLPSLSEGEWVRITSDLLPSRTVAFFLGFRGDTLLAVRRSEELVSLPLSRIERLETARRDRWRGALIGAPVGALVLTTGLAIWFHSQGGVLDCNGCPFTDDLAFGAAWGVPIGGLVGALTGGLIGVERWDPVPRLPGRP